MRPFSCLESGSFSFIEVTGSAGHLDFILAGELRTKASGRRNSHPGEFNVFLGGEKHWWRLS